tara:strand:- start:228 stop:455 length:228 start_codon:yes stop_codon:yes gene_type:complete
MLLKSVKNVLRKKEMQESHPNCGTPNCCGECDPIDETMTTADAGIPQDTKNMGPGKKKTPPVLLKRFKKFIKTDD